MICSIGFGDFSVAFLESDRCLLMGKRLCMKHSRRTLSSPMLFAKYLYQYHKDEEVERHVVARTIVQELKLEHR